MLSVKESLRTTVDSISDEEALRVLSFIEQMRKHPVRSSTLKRLASDPMFKVPPRKLGAFAKVDPMEGKGAPASRLLVEDRR
jgi:hypothetical protein